MKTYCLLVAGPYTWSLTLISHNAPVCPVSISISITGVNKRASEKKSQKQSVLNQDYYTLNKTVVRTVRGSIIFGKAYLERKGVMTWVTVLSFMLTFTWVRVKT